MAEEAKKRTLGPVYNKQLQHFKPSKAYRRGTNDDIKAWKETKKKATPTKPKDLPQTLYGMKTEMRKYEIPPLEDRKQMRRDFEEARTDFLIDLATNHAEDLKKAGISKRQIGGMKQGKTPNGFNTHHILPIHGGGTNDFSNLCLMKLHPYHEDVHNKFINPQLRNMQDGDSRMVKLPVPSGPVFVPSEKVKEQVASKDKNDKPKTKKAGRKVPQKTSKLQKKTMSKIYSNRGR